ncbi:DUF4232 domain-containing protein [Nocardia sp. NPDC004722]
MRFTTEIFAVGAVVLAAVGCSSNTTAPQTVAPTTSGVTSVAVPSATSPAAQHVPATADVTGCGSGQVDVTGAVMSPATGHRGVKLTFSLAAGSAPCTLTGYPGVDSGAGGPLLHADRTPRGFMGGLPQGSDEPPTVTLDSGHPATAVVEGVAFDADGNGCSLYTNLMVTPPNSTDTRTVTVTIDSCALHVHPVTG